MDPEQMTVDQWALELEEPIFTHNRRVSSKVAEEELAMFKRAQSALQG